MKPALIVVGATGGVGRGVVRAALDRGHAVVAVARHAAALDALRLDHPRANLTCMPGSVASDGEGAALATRLRDLRRPVSGIVVSVCGQAQGGRVLDRPADFLRRKLDDDLLPHLAAARNLLPLLAERGRGSYLLIGGPGSEHPWAGYGHRSIGAAALRMLARVLHDEARAVDVRVQLLTVDVPVCTGSMEAPASPRWPSALAIGQHAVALVEQAAPAAPVVHYEPARSPAFGPDGNTPADGCNSLASVRALLGRFSQPASKKDLSP